MKKIISLVIAIMMFSSIAVYAVDVSYPADLTVDDFESYTEGRLIPYGSSGDKWDDYADRGYDDAWQPLIGVDPEDSDNQVLRAELKPTANGTMRSLVAATPDVKGVVTISFDLYIPHGEVIEGTDTLYNNTEERTNFIAFSASSAGTAKELLLAKLWLNRVAGGTDRPKFDIGGSYYNLPGYNVWHNVKFVIDMDEKITKYYITGGDEPDATSRFSTDEALDFFRMYVSTGIRNSLLYMDNFNMTYVKNETIDENDISLTYTAPSFDLQSGSITVNGSVSPYFAQNVYASVYMEEDSEFPITESEAKANADGTFSITLEIPDGVRGWANVVVSTDHIMTDSSSRTSKLFIATADDEAQMLELFNAFPYEDNPETDENEKDGVILTLENYLPMSISEDEYTAFNENKDFFAEYFMARAKEGTSYADLTTIGAAFRSAQIILAVTEADDAELISLLDDAEYINAEELTEEVQAEYIRIWNEYADSLRCESDIQKRIEKIHPVALVNCARKSEIHGILSDYKEVFDLTEEELNPENVDVDVVCSELNDKGYNFPEDVKNAYLESIENYTEEKEEENKKPSGGSSGGGGGGGSFGGGNKGGGKKVEADNKVVEENLPEVAPEEPVIPEEKEEITDTIFADVENHWAKDYINELSSLNIVKGYEDGTFKPDKAVTRAEFVKMIVTLLGLSEEKADFADVYENDWYYGVVGAASKAGLVTGDGKNFNPNAMITRQDAAVIICRALKMSGNEETTFADNNEISDYAKNAVGALAQLGIISGYEDNTVRPLNLITRGETAKILVNANSLLKALTENN